jgi:hypothetical protein
MHDAPAAAISLLSALALTTLPACNAPCPRSPAAPVRPAAADDRDHFIGFYRMPDYDWRSGAELPGEGTIIPVLKHGDTYFSVSRGAEVPLKPCPAGLEWAHVPSSMAGTTIGCDPATAEYYICVFDRRAEDFIPDSMDPAPYRGLRRALYRIAPPRWLRDPTAAPPQALEDFAGFYDLLWWPAVISYSIRNQNGSFTLQVSIAGHGAEEAKALTPLPDQLGFEGPEKYSRLVYNAALRRFELVLQSKDAPAIRMPLVRFSLIGIPATKG